MTDQTNSKKTDSREMLVVSCAPGQDPEVQTAKAVLGSALPSAIVAGQWSQGYGGKISLTAGVKAIQDAGSKVNAGDMSEVEGRLVAQATALDALFGDLSRRAAANVREYPEAFERYLKLALKAQNQCRMTLETLANVKNPPVVYAKQANINNGGQQQVNNGNTSRGQDGGNGRGKLLEQSHEQRVDTGTEGQAGGGDPALEAVGAVNRAEVG